jgi:hypothetical protein
MADIETLDETPIEQEEQPMQKAKKPRSQAQLDAT